MAEHRRSQSYHCPNTTCNGHFYAAYPHGRLDLVCEKCGLRFSITPYGFDAAGATGGVLAAGTGRLFNPFFWISLILLAVVFYLLPR
jgi:hypothetical protein